VSDEKNRARKATSVLRERTGHRALVVFRCRHTRAGRLRASASCSSRQADAGLSPGTGPIVMNTYPNCRQRHELLDGTFIKPCDRLHTRLLA